MKRWLYLRLLRWAHRGQLPTEVILAQSDLPPNWSDPRDFDGKHLSEW